MSNYKKKKRLVDILSANIGEKPIAHIVPADIIESQLALKEKNAIRDAYKHASYLEQRRRLMQNWADYLYSLRSGA